MSEPGRSGAAGLSGSCGNPHYWDTGQRYDWYDMDARALIQEATEADLELFSSLRGRRHPEGTFIGDGDKVLRRMLKTTRVLRILCTPEWVQKLPIPDGIDVRVAPLSRLISIVGFRLHQGLMALGTIPMEKPL